MHQDKDGADNKKGVVGTRGGMDFRRTVGRLRTVMAELRTKSIPLRRTLRRFGIKVSLDGCYRSALGGTRGALAGVIGPSNSRTGFRTPTARARKR